MTAPASPPATRLRPPSWLDWRLALGVALVVGAALIGARLIGSAQETARVWAVNSSLAAGTVLKASDVRVVRVRLPENSAQYLAADRSPVGRTLARDVGRDELLPRSALTGAPCGSRVSIPVSAQHVPAGIAAGQRIDLYATVTGAEPQRVLQAAIVQAVQRPPGGGSEWSVVVRVPAARAAEVVRAVRTAQLDVTVVNGPAAEEPCEPAATESSPAPSPGTSR